MEAIEIQTRDLFGWFTEKLLDVRDAREKHDILAPEEPFGTLYLAGLLTHLITTPWLLQLDRDGARLDMDVAQITSKAGTPRQRMEGFQHAADRYLLYLGLWDGLQGHQQGRYYQISEANLANRACAYYGFAANLAQRLPPPTPLAHIFRELAANLGTYLSLLLSLRGDILNLFPKITPGEEFHLARG